MAILDEVPGLTVTIDVAGHDITEYDDEDEQQPQPHTRYVYVQAESGANFGIATKFDASIFPHANECIFLHLYLDGKSICTWSYTPAHITSARRLAIDNLQSDLGDRYMLQKFSFAELNISEGAADVALWGKLTALGTISVQCFRVRFEDVPPPPPPQPKPKRGKRRAVAKGRKSAPKKTVPPPNARNLDTLNGALLDNDQVPEKNLKGRAVSHQARLSISAEIPHNPEAAQDKDKPKPRMIYLQNEPFATFQFKYRSRGALQALRVIETTPPPIPLEDRPLDELTQEQLKELVTMQKEQLMQRVKIKKEKRDLPNDEDNGDDEPKFVETLSKKKQKTVEVVDLSEE